MAGFNAPRDTIENRQSTLRDIRLDECVIAPPPRPDIAFAFEYTLTPEEVDLGAAYLHAIRTESEIHRVVHSAAHRIDVLVNAECKRLTKLANWFPDTQRVATISGRLSSIVRPPGTTDSRAIFIMSELIRDAAFVLDKRSCDCEVSDELRFQLMVPVKVLGAFALELQLKCLYCIETGKSLWGHDLIDLFDSLSQGNRDKIEKDFDAYEAVDPHAIAMKAKLGASAKYDIRSILTEQRNAFQDWRYIYERQPRSGSVVNVQRAVRKLILELEPNWTVLRSAIPVIFNPRAEFVKP